MAVVKKLEVLAAENPSIFVANVHPGMVDTEIFRKSGATPELLPMDSDKFINLHLMMFTEFLDCDLSRVPVFHDLEAGNYPLFVCMEFTVVSLQTASSSYLVGTFHALALQPRSGFPARRIGVGKLGCGGVESCSVEDTRGPPNDRRCCMVAI